MHAVKMEQSHLKCLLILQWAVIFILFVKLRRSMELLQHRPPVTTSGDSKPTLASAGAAREVSAKVCSAEVDYRTEYAELPPFTLPEDIAFIMGEDTNGDLKPFPAADFLKSLEIMRCTLNDALRIARTTTGPRGPTGPKGTKPGPRGPSGKNGKNGKDGKCRS